MWWKPRGEYLARGVANGPRDWPQLPAPSAAARAKPRFLFVDYDSTLNPGQGNLPLTPERAAMLRAFLSRARLDLPELQVFVLTASNPAKKHEALAAAGLRELFDGVLSSSMPKKYESKGQYLRRWITKRGAAGGDVMHLDDSVQAIQSILEGGGDESAAPAPVCNTLRLPYMGAGLVEEDLLLVARRFLYAGGCPEDGLPIPPGQVAAAPVHANVIYVGGERHVDGRDSAVKCMLDSLDADARQDILRQNAAAEDGGPSPRFLEWIAGRPDLRAAAEA